MGKERYWYVKDHTSDFIIEGKGSTIESAFEAIAIALQSVIVDINSIVGKIVVGSVVRSSRGYEELLFEFLSYLVYIKDVEKFVFKDINVKIHNLDNENIILEFEALGDRIDVNSHVVLTDVKGVTYSQLAVFKERDYYICRCVVDV
ncbi:MAG: archease [Brevinematales bacterium]|nr:archease [Brevinematales bacterium]